jgi:hypothetical protein
LQLIIGKIWIGKNTKQKIQKRQNQKIKKIGKKVYEYRTLDYTEEELANSDSSWEACADVSYAYCNEEPVTEEDRRMKACADEFNKEYEKSRAIHPLVDNFGDEQKDMKDNSDDDDCTFFTHSKGKCTRIEKTQSVIIENYSDPGTPMQNSIEYSPHSPQYSPISYHNYSSPNHIPIPSTYECRSDEDAVKRARTHE